MQIQPETLIVTRHKALVTYLIEIGLADPQTPVIDHATANDVRGHHIIGVLPLSLARCARTVTEVPLALTPDDRGMELEIERIRQIAGEPITYVVAEEEILYSAARGAIAGDRDLLDEIARERVSLERESSETVKP